MENSEERIAMACPYNGKLCIGGIREDFPQNEVKQRVTCRMWVGVAGKLPQSEKVVHQYDCAFAWQVTTHIEMSQTNRFVASSSDKISNEVHDVVGAYQILGRSLQAVGNEFRILNENIKRLPEPGTPEVLEIPPNGHEGTDE